MGSAPKSSGTGGPSRALTAVIVALLVLSIPWYFPAGDGGPFILGVPLWCVVAFGCYCAIAAIVATLMPALWDERPGHRE